MALHRAQTFQCVHCNKRFNKKYRLTFHLSKHTKSYVCTLCNKSVFLFRSLRNHLRYHVQKRNLCTLCNRSMKCLYKLKVHLLGHVLAESYPYACRKCHKIFLQERGFRCHQLAHLQKKFFQCESCGKSFNKNLTFQRHKLADCQLTHCSICNEDFLSNFAFRKHAFKKHASNMPHVCTVCRKSFSSDQGLQRHRSMYCHRVTLYKCLECNKSFKTLNYMKKHMNFHNGPSIKSFTSERGLQRHRRTHCHRTIQYKCLDCNKSFKTLNYTKKHMNFHNGPSIKSFTSDRGLQRHRRIHCHKATHYTCLDCNKYFKTFSHVKRHMNSHIKLPGLSLRCELCLKIFMSRNGFENHKKGHLNDNNTQRAFRQSNQSIDTPMQRDADVYIILPKENKNYSCPHCYKKFEKLCDIKKHLCSHIKSSESISEYNTMRATSLSNESLTSINLHKDAKVKGYTPGTIGSQQEDFRLQLNKKVLTKDNDKKGTVDRPHTCNVCSRAFKYKYNLKRHASVHEAKIAKIPFQCSVCQKKFATKRGRRTHEQLSHYICPICDCSFANRFCLFSHINTHSELHTCNVCPRTFVYKSDLKRHALTHKAKTAKITFKCPVCQKEFDTQQGRRTHEYLSHYVCPICDGSFASRFRLFCHTRKHSELTGFNQKPLEEAMFSQTQWGTTARMVPAFSPYGYSMLAPRFTENTVPRQCTLYNGLEESSHPTMDRNHDHTRPYNDHNGFTNNREMLANHYSLPQF